MEPLLVFDKLVKQIAVLMKFKEIWLFKHQKKDEENCCKRLSVENLNKAEFEIYREAQLESLQLNLTTYLTINPSQIKLKFYPLLQFLLKILFKLVAEYKKETYRTIANIKLFSVSLTRYQS